jgi:hypothetical protein
MIIFYNWGVVGYGTKNMVINVGQHNGIRHGDFEIHGIKGNFPIQINTSTNLGYATDMHVPNFNFRTNILEINLTSRTKILADSNYRNRQITKISRMIRCNPDKLCLLMPNAAKSKKISREENLSLIQFQIECGFKIIKVFFHYNRFTLENAIEYRNLIPKDRTLMFVLDEKLNPTVFEKLYLDAYENHKDEIIGFLGRAPNVNNNKIRRNLVFIKSRDSDKIVRLVSATNRWFGGIVSSLIFHLFGFDLYSFRKGAWKENMPIEELRVLSEFSSEPLTSTSDFVCVVTGMPLYISALMMNAVGKSYVPVSIHNIVRLNQLFEILQERYTRPQLELVVGNLFF